MEQTVKAGLKLDIHKRIFYVLLYKYETDGTRTRNLCRDRAVL